MMYEIVIFGYDEYAKEIASVFRKNKSLIQIYLLDEMSCKEAKEDGYEAEVVELDDDWLNLEQKFDIEKMKCFCSLSNDAQNVFLTISLRAQYPHLEIISLATSEQSAQKLRFAGASETIAKLEATAHIIVESLERPIAMEVLDEIIYKNNEFSMEELHVTSTSTIYGLDVKEVREICEAYELVLLTLSGEDKKMNFTFSVQSESLVIQEGSVLVMMGKNNDIKKFESDKI